METTKREDFIFIIENTGHNIACLKNMRHTSSSPLGFKSTDEKPCTLDDGQNWKFNLITNKRKKFR